MSRLKLSMFSCLLVTLLLTVVLRTDVAQAAPACGAWNIIPSASPGTSSNALLAVASASSTNYWAVGNTANSGGPLQTLTEHLGRTGWTVVPSPNAGSGSNTLFGVSAVSASNVWAVGVYTNSSGTDQTLTEQWNGTSWTVVPSPNGGSGNVLAGVSAVSASDIWAVGYSNYPGAPQTLIENWNGTGWNIVPSPNVAGSNQDLLTGVVAIDMSNVWAVGYYRNSSNTYQTLIEHWNGTSWNVVASPNGGSGNNSLYGVAAVSASAIWAVGIFTGSSGAYQTLTEQWNGTSWNVVPSPSVGTGTNVLNAVAVVSASNVWAVGAYTNSSGTAQTLTEQWNGTSWNVVPSPSIGPQNNLYGVTHIRGTATAVLAVGFSNNAQQTLSMFYC